MASKLATEVRAPVTGWLQKRKSSNKSGLLKSVNKRFFTLDFESQIFYYSHSEGNKYVSMFAFRQILSVESLTAEPAVQEASEHPVSTGTQSSKSSLLHRMPFSSNAMMRSIPKFSGYAKRATEHYGFVVKLEGKSLEVLCRSKEEADKWICGMQDAMALSRQLASTHPGSLEQLASASISEHSTTPPSSQKSSPRSGSQSAAESEPTSPWLSPGGTFSDFPPMAPEQMDCNIECGSLRQVTQPPLAPSWEGCLRATAASA